MGWPVVPLTVGPNYRGRYPKPGGGYGKRKVHASPLCLLGFGLR